jgi:hypothetical protein
MYRGMFRIAAICAGFYLAVQTFQFVLFRLVLATGGGPVEAAIARLEPLETVRAVLLLISMFALVPVYVAIALRCFRAAPGTALSGLIFGVAFVLFELAYRTIDLFLVSQVWAAAVRDGGDAAAAALERIQLWEAAIGAWYFVLLAAHLLASICFAAAVHFQRGPDAEGRWDVLAVIAFALNAVRLVGRLLGSHGGVEWLLPLSGRFYFPAVGVIMVLLTIWLARQASRPTS